MIAEAIPGTRRREAGVRRSRGLAILAFHRVRRARDPLFPDELDANAFRQRMRWLRAFFNVVPLSQGVNALCDATLPARAVSITFDDGYADNVEVALPILRELRLDATVFVATSFLSGENMWNDRIIESIRSTALQELDLRDLGLDALCVSDIASRRAAVGTLLSHAKYLEQSARDEFVRQVEQRAGRGKGGPLMMTPAYVQAAVHGGMDIGAHTRTHPILSGISGDHARAEIVGSKRELEAILSREVALFAYPNGLPGKDYRSEHAIMVRESGFRGAVCTQWGVARSDDDPFQLPRMMPWDRDPLRFSLRLGLESMRMARQASAR